MRPETQLKQVNRYFGSLRATYIQSTLKSYINK